MKKPSTLTPYKVELFSYEANDKVVVGLLTEDSTIDDAVIVAEFPYEIKDGNRESLKDAEFVKEACNMYQPMIELLESIEATTTDKKSSNKIHKFLKDNKLWS